MTGTPFTAAVDRTLAHAIHALACFAYDPLVAPGYARTDARLRRALGQTAPVPEDDIAGPVEVLLAAPPNDIVDADWFAHRWELADEGAACATHAAQAAERAAAFPCPRLLGDLDTREVVVATPLRATALGIASPSRVRVVCGPATSGSAIVMAAIAARFASRLPLPELDLDDARFVRHQCAGSALLRSGDAEPYLDALLESASGDLPATHHGDTLEQRVPRIAPSLDQPPGELMRLGKGLARRYPDRLHRAWLRGVFVPRGFDLDAWLGDLPTAT